MHIIRVVGLVASVASAAPMPQDNLLGTVQAPQQNGGGGLLGGLLGTVGKSQTQHPL